MSKPGWYRLGNTTLTVIVIALSAAACVQAAPTSLPTPTRPSPLTPYLSPTPSQSVVPGARRENTSTPPPPPTPAPVTYKVVKGDTMLGIALRYGVRLEELLAANPEVNPRFLSVDTVLVIPQAEQEPEAFTTPTPPPVDLDDPVCYPTFEAGAWCFLLVVNDQSYGLENVSAWIGLYTAEGEAVVGETGITPLNLLPAGERMPIVARFSPPVPENFTSSSDRFSAYAVPEKTERYLITKLSVDQVEISEAGLQALLQGTVGLPKRSEPAKLIWVLGVAYDIEGRVVGVRRWEAEGSNEPESEVVLHGGERLPFSFAVYSLGPEIDRVEVLVEAR